MKDRIIKRMWKHMNVACKFYLTRYANKDQVLELVKASVATLGTAMAVAKMHNLSDEAAALVSLEIEALAKNIKDRKGGNV